MPKRKHECKECNYIKHKHRKHKKHSRRHRRSPSTSSTSSESQQLTQEYEGDSKHDSRANTESPVDDIIFCDEKTTEPLVKNAPQAEQSTVNNKGDDPAPSTESADAASEILDPVLLEILGADPSSKSEFGKEIHKDLANRLEHIATSGLSKETRKELIEKYLVPKNCIRVGAPIMNPEIKAALPELTQKRDKGIESRQKQLTSAIACLGEIITQLMNLKDKDSELIKGLLDTIRMLCDIQHTDSVKRRYFTFSALKKDINDQLTHTKIDKFLFGENLAETLKAAKAVSKSGAEIKLDTNLPKNAKKTVQPQPLTAKNLNWRAPPPARRQPGPAPQQAQRMRPPAPPRKHKTSSRPWQHQHKRPRHH